MATRRLAVKPSHHVMPGHGKTVMLVDDEYIVRTVVSQMLEELGYHAIPVDSGEEAIDRYDPKHIHLVLLDLVMPGMDGRQTFNRLRAVNPDVKVVLTSGYGQLESIDAALGDGCMGFIQKPFSLDELSEFLGSVLDASNEV